MDRRSAEETCKRVRLSQTFLGGTLQLRVVDYDPRDGRGWGIVAGIEAKVPHRETGEVCSIFATVTLFDAYLWATIAAHSDGGISVLVKAVRNFLSDFALHEIDELLRLDGRQVRDPHVSKIALPDHLRNTVLDVPILNPAKRPTERK